MMRIFTVLGARPQFIKAATVSRALAELPGVRETLVHTGQHHDANMSEVFFDELGIPAPGHNLGIAGGGHGAMTGRMLEALEALFEAECPDRVLVYGDTTSTLAGALAAVKLHIPVAHVEAGLRSFNKRMPEEINRILTDHCADLLFTPTETATRNLRNEGVGAGHIVEVGDVMYDAALLYGARAAARGAGAARLELPAGGYVLATVHRQENTDDPERLAAIFAGLARVAEEMPVVLPLHPRTRARLDHHGLGALVDRLTVIAPTGYLDMVGLERNAAVIATDSGGIQKEAFFHGVPCVTLRDETEWGELVEGGWNRLCPPTEGGVVAGQILAAVSTVGASITPYGNGNAAGAIATAVVEWTAA